MPEVHTPSQTIGPLYGFALLFCGSENMMPPGRPGAVPLRGRVFEGGGAPVPRVLVEAWHGELVARAQTDADGAFRMSVVKPPPAELPGGGRQAPPLEPAPVLERPAQGPPHPHLLPDEALANADDPVLRLVPPGDRGSLLVAADGDGLRFDIHLRGENETAFFAA